MVILEIKHIEYKATFFDNSIRKLDTPESIARYMKDAFNDHPDQEQLWCIYADPQLRPIVRKLITIGSNKENIVDLRTIFKYALLTNAVNVFMIHNHPSGSLLPSDEDFTMTKKMVEAGKALTIPVVDHLIMNGFDEQIYSIKRELPNLFEK